MKSLFLVCFLSRREFWTPLPPQRDIMSLMRKISNICTISFSISEPKVVHRPVKNPPLLQRISKTKEDFFFHDEVSNNKKLETRLFYAVNYLWAIFENLFEASKVFDMLKVRGGSISRSESSENFPLFVPFIHMWQQQQGQLTPVSTYLWPSGDAGARVHLKKASVRWPRGRQGAEPFLPTVGPLRSAFLPCSHSSVPLWEGGKGGLSWIMWGVSFLLAALLRTHLSKACARGWGVKGTRQASLIRSPKLQRGRRRWWVGWGGEQTILVQL